MEPLRVLLVDDEALVRAGIGMLLRGETDLEIVGEAANGYEALELLADAMPDVVLMDVRMPEMDGVEATRRIVEGQAPAAGDAIRILMLTTYHADEHVYAALRAGASGYVLKDTAPDLLLHAIRAVGGGDAYLHPTVAKQLLGTFARQPDQVTPDPGDIERLTPRELEMLVLVAHGLTNRQIMARLVLSEATVKTHVGRLIMKLGVETRAQLVTYAFHSGVVAPGSTLP